MRTYMILGIKAINSNFNADFSERPKTLPSGEIFASDKVLKYSMRKYWQENKKDVFMIKSLNPDKDFEIRTLEERYTSLFGKIKDQTKTKVFENLLTQTDIRQFGAAFAVSNYNLSITGAIQISQGINKYEDTEIFEQTILSPFKNSKSEKAKNSTLGSMTLTDECHYFYDIVVNPKSYQEYVNANITKAYDNEDLEDLKNAALESVTALNTNPKKGCDNEFLMIINTEDDKYLPNLKDLINLRKENKKVILTLDKTDLLDDLDIEIYKDPKLILENFPNVKTYNIYTKKEI